MQLERYIDKESAIHKWDPRCKLAVVFILVFISASVKTPPGLFLILIFAVSLFISARLPLRRMLDSLRSPLILLLLMFPLLLFASGGEAPGRIGVFSFSRKGLISFLIIAVRLCSIIIIFTSLFSTSRLNTIIKAMEYFHIPQAVTGVFMFTYRYIFTFSADLKKLSAAANLRGYRFSKGIAHISTTVSILVNLLIRSFDQSERTYQALCLRGYTGKTGTLDQFHFARNDAFKTAVSIFAAGAVLVSEYLWSSYAG